MPERPLTRQQVTVASRIMLPTYIALNTIVGLVYLLDPLGRLQRVPALAFQREVMPMPAWGCVFLALAAAMLVATRRHSRPGMVFALYSCGIAWLLWGAGYEVSVFRDPNASILGPVLPWTVTIACHASAKSLLHGEAH